MSAPYEWQYAPAKCMAALTIAETSRTGLRPIRFEIGPQTSGKKPRNTMGTELRRCGRSRRGLYKAVGEYAHKVRRLRDADAPQLDEGLEGGDNGGRREGTEHGVKGDLDKESMLAPRRPVVRVWKTGEISIQERKTDSTRRDSFRAIPFPNSPCGSSLGYKHRELCQSHTRKQFGAGHGSARPLLGRDSRQNAPKEQGRPFRAVRGPSRVRKRRHLRAESSKVCPPRARPAGPSRYRRRPGRRSLRPELS